MWQDEDFYNPDFQDPEEPKTKLYDEDKELYYQPIGSTKRNILNAITGQEYPYRIGSKDERRFFIIMKSDPWNPKEACRLFFTSPKEYEEFSGNVVPREGWERFRANQQTFR
jgi:hypothetical protein